MLATRLENVAGKLIHFDQTGFKGIVASDNLRRLLHFIDIAHKEDCAVFSLEAEKAFDHLEWGYLWMVLEKFGFGQKFISMLKVLYGGITASVPTGTFQSSALILNRGTRQG